MEPKSTSTPGASTPPAPATQPSPEPLTSSSENIKTPVAEESVVPSENPAPDPSLLSALDSTPAAPQPSIMPAPASAKPSKKAFDFKKIFGKWYFWAMIGCIIFAIFGIGFAAYTLTENAKAEDRITQLEKELDEKNQLLVKYGAQLGQIVGDSSRPGYEGDKDDDKTEQPSIIASSDYIYIGEWGIKLKIADGLKNVSYTFNNDAYPDENGNARSASSICLSGILKDMDYTPEAFRMDNIRPGFGCLARRTREELIQSGQVPEDAITEDEYQYLYSSPQAAASTTEQEQAWELEIIKLIQQTLSDRSTF